MPLAALKKFKSFLSKKYFYPFGVKSANKNATILVISSLLTTLISYSVILQLIYPHRQSTTSFIDGHTWQFSPHVAVTSTSQNKYIAQQIHITTADQTAITKEQVKSAFDIYESLTESRALLNNKMVLLRDICVTSETTCLVHSPLSFWNLKDLDNDFANYKFNINKRFHNLDSSVHPYSTMSHVRFDQQGIFYSGDGLILTFILKNNTLDVWNALWEHTKSELNLIESQLQADPLLLQFKWKLLPFISWRAMIVFACAIGLFAYIRTRFSQTNLLKSKSGLGISVLFLSFACFTTTVGLLRFVHYETVTPWPFQLLICTTSTLEHALLLTSAVISKGKDLSRNERIGKGYQQVGVSMISTLIGELVVLSVGGSMRDKSVKSFCLFSSVALVVALALNLTLFTAILSIDIRRAELTDLGSENSKKYEFRRRNSFDQKFKTKRAINVLVICFILLYLSMFKPSYAPPKQLALVIDDDVKYTQLSSLAHQFWYRLNPSYDTVWLEVQPPHVVFTSKNNELITKRLTDLQSALNDKLQILRSSLASHDNIAFDIISPLILLLLKINIPGFMLSIILVGIILWMVPSIREGILLPTLRKIFVYICLFLLRCISRITPFKTDYLIRKVENEYNEDGMHMGAISMQSQFNKLQNQNCVQNVKIRTLDGKHIPDLEFLDASARKVISSDQFGAMILWDIDEARWIGRLDHLRLLDNHRWVAETNPEYLDYDDYYSEHLDAVCKQAPRPYCIKLHKAGRWVSAGFDNGVIALWDTQSAQLIREFSVNNNGSSRCKEQKDNKHTHSNDRVVKLEFLNNNCLLSVHKNGTFREWSINGGEMVQQIQSRHVREVTNICVLTSEQNDTGDQSIISSSKDSVIQCWKRHIDSTGESHWNCLYSIEEQAEITSIAAQQLHNGMGILVTGSIDNAVKVWDLTHGNLLCVLSKESNRKKKVPEAEVGGPLLQFSKVAESFDTHHPLSNSHILKQDMVISDHTDSICQVVATRIGNPEFENDCCPNCHVVVDSGFFVASCSKDNTVHAWRLDRHTGREIVGCTTCFKDYHRQQHYMNNRLWKADAPGTPLAGFRYQKRSKKENFTSEDESESDMTMERLSLLPKFLGKLDQVAGHGLVFCEKMVLAGVRRRNVSTGEENLWEAWFASLQYYEPPSLEEEASLIPVITFDLEKDDHSETNENIPKHPSLSLCEQLLYYTFGIRKVRTFSAPANRPKYELKKKKKKDTYIIDEDDEAYDILPFSAIHKVVRTADGYGFCCDYGNFMKVITFDRHGN